MKNISKFNYFILEKEELSKKEQIAKMSKQLKTNIENNKSLEKDKPKIDSKTGEPVSDKSNLDPKTQIIALSRQVYDAMLSAGIDKYKLKKKVAKMKKDESADEDEIADFEEMEADITANSQLRADSIELQMIAIAADSPKLVFLAQKLAAEAKNRGMAEATKQMQDIIDKKESIEKKPDKKELNDKKESTKKDDDKSSKK